MAEGEGKRASVTAQELAAQVAKLSQTDTKEQCQIAKEKPDEMDLAGAKKRLSVTQTVEKVNLPTAEDIAKEAAGCDITAAAEAALGQKRASLKSVDTDVKNTLPTQDCINAENSADVMAGEILGEAKRKLSATDTIEKFALPTAEDIKAEKKDKACAVLSSEQMSKAATSKTKAEAHSASLGTVDKKSLAVGGAGAGGGFGLNAPGFGVKVQHFAGGGEAKKQIDVAQDVIDAWGQVLDDSAKNTWVYAKYSDDLKKLSLQATGEGGLSEFKAQIGETMAWGGFKCYGVDKRGGTEVRRTKFVFVQVRPEGVNMIKKAKQTSHKTDVKAAITGAHMDIAVETLADLDEQGLIAKLQAATGAHKPNGYEFEPGVFLEADFYGLGIGKDCKGETADNK